MLKEITACFLIVVVTAQGQSKVGTTIGQFLLIEPSARVAAMGNAGSTLYGEVQSVYYNPGSAGFLQRSGVQFTHTLWLADIAYDYAAATISLGESGNLIATVTSLSSGEIDVRTVEQPLGTGERYTVQNLAFGIGYARQISDRFSVGVQVNYIQETIWHSSLVAFGLNVGTLYRVGTEGLHIGASLSNFGTRGSYDGRDLRIQFDRDPKKYGDNSALPAAQAVESFPLPILFRVGLSYPLMYSEEHELRFAVDAFHPSDNTESVSLGAEWTFNRVLILRGGYQNLFLRDSEVGWTFGGGIRYDAGGYVLGMDYAWADHGRLKDTHRFTLAVYF